MNVNFEWYKVFYFVASTLSFSEASEKLFITQSAVSQSIKQLEERLNCKLFLRSTKQVLLTQEGEHLFRHIEQAYNFIKAGERSIEEIHSLQKGEVRIGASDTICKYYLMGYFQEFHRKYPSVKIHVTNRTSPECIHLLEKGSVDFIVINLPAKSPYPQLDMKPIKAIQDVFIGGSSFSHLKDRKVSLQELSQLPLLMLEKNTTTREFFDRYSQGKGFHIIPEIELGSVDLLIEMTRIGLGISFVPKDYIQKDLAEGAVFVLDVEDAIPTRTLGIMTHRRLPVSMAAAKFMELLR